MPRRRTSFTAASVPYACANRGPADATGRRRSRRSATTRGSPSVRRSPAGASIMCTALISQTPASASAEPDAALRIGARRDASLVAVLRKRLDQRARERLAAIEQAQRERAAGAAAAADRSPARAPARGRPAGASTARRAPPRRPGRRASPWHCARRSRCPGWSDSPRAARAAMTRPALPRADSSRTPRPRAAPATAASGRRRGRCPVGATRSRPRDRHRARLRSAARRAASTRTKRTIRAGSRGSVSPGQPVPTRCAIAIGSAGGAAKRSGSSQYSCAVAAVSAAAAGRSPGAAEQRRLVIGCRLSAMPGRARPAAARPRRRRSPRAPCRRCRRCRSGRSCERSRSAAMPRSSKRWMNRARLVFEPIRPKKPKSPRRRIASAMRRSRSCSCVSTR